MFGLGFTAGLYALPLQSFMQLLPASDHRGRVLASCNALSFLFMGAGSLGYWKARPLFGDHPQWIFVLCGIIAFFAWIICRRIPSIESQPSV
jgi:acyl-[acyl-carrier-protein]-phospholipid O-acyltransferase/long-chain-fatty-acid--[acyl-carrier-protein] ligase